MDALTWFKSVFQRAQATSPPLPADLASESWTEMPLHLAAARLRPVAAPADDDEDWDAVIARAKMQAAAPRAPSPPPARNEWAEMPETPPPAPKVQAGISKATQAKLDALMRGGMKKPARAEPRRAAGPLSRR